MWNDETRFAVLAGLGALAVKVATRKVDDRETLADLRLIAKLLGPHAMTKPETGPGVRVWTCPSDGLADEVRAAGFRLSDTQVEDLVRSATTATASGSDEVRRQLAWWPRRTIPKWAVDMGEDGREAYLRKLVREHALEPARPRQAPRPAPEPEREPEQRSLAIDRPVSIHEFLAEHPDLAEKAKPLLEGMGGIVAPGRPKIIEPPPPLDGDALEAAKRRAKGG